jgi:serralysin
VPTGASTVCGCPICRGDSAEPLYAGDGSDELSGTKPVWSLQQIVSNLSRSDARWGEALVPYTFYGAAPAHLAAQSDWKGFVSFTGEQREATRLALELISDVADVQFVERADDGSEPGPANPRLTFSTSLSTAQYFTGYAMVNATDGLDLGDAHRIVSGELMFNGHRWAGSMDPGFRPFSVLMHEIMHGLGLSHPGAYNRNANEEITYGKHAEYAQDSAQFTVMSYFGAGATGSLHSGFPDTPLLHDVAALQSLYGANTTTRAGDTVYGHNSTANRQSYDFNLNPSPIFTVWDGGGVDTLDFSLTQAVVSLDLNEGRFSDAFGMTNNISIAFGVVIENARGGATGDTILGNPADNLLEGLDGDDALAGAAGRDVLDGSRGRDRLFGGGDADSVYGGLDDDLLLGDAGNDLLLGDAGLDIANGGLGADLINGGEGDDVIGGAEDADLVGGALGNDQVFGDGGNDTVFGDGGFDTVNGGEGDDQVNGGDGDDLIGGGDGRDFLGGGLGADTMFGDDGADFMLGDEGADTVYGGGDNDVIFGIGGDDVLRGDGGNDRLFGDDGDDVIAGGGFSDLINGGAGRDLIGGGDQDDVLGGGEGADQIFGEDGGDLIFGDGGADTINGGGGGDNVNGGAGQDLVGGGDGNDLMGGGDEADTLYGDAGDDVLYGDAGADVLLGGGGWDRLYGGDGADRFVFSALGDSGGPAPDRIFDFRSDMGDVIDISGIDANATAAGDQAFAFVGAFSNRAAQAVLSYDAGANLSTLRLDVNGDGQADFNLLIEGQQGQSGFVL